MGKYQIVLDNEGTPMVGLVPGKDGKITYLGEQFGRSVLYHSDGSCPVRLFLRKRLLECTDDEKEQLADRERFPLEEIEELSKEDVNLKKKMEEIEEEKKQKEALNLQKRQSS